MACSGVFGVPDTTRTCDPGLRRLVLYPTELLGHISKIFNFSPPTDSNELPLRMRPLNLSALPNRAANTCRLYKIKGNGKSTAKLGQGKQLLLYCLYYQIASMRAAVKEL